MKTSKSKENAGVVALIVWLDASEKNAQQDGVDWVSGFHDVKLAQDALRLYFTDDEITNFILNKDRLKTIIATKKQGVINGN